MDSDTWRNVLVAALLNRESGGLVVGLGVAGAVAFFALSYVRYRRAR